MNTVIDIKYVAEMLKKCRWEKGITQNELAQMLSVTPQSISKWERGEGLPDLENLCALAGVFSVPLDVLLNRQRTDGQTFIGIYGGASTRFVLVSERGVVLNSIVLGGVSGGVQTTAELLCQGIDYLHPKAMNVAGIYYIGPGLDTERERVFLLQRTLRQRYPDAQFGCCGTVSAALSCSEVPPERCLAVIGGLSSCVVYWMDGETYARTGRGGHLARPNGSRYNIGHDVLVAVCEDRDEVGPKTMLTPMLESWLGGQNIKSYINSITKRGPTYIASFAEMVTHACEEGDQVAYDILKDNSAHLARLIHQAWGKSPQADHVVLASSLFTGQNDVFYRLLREQVDPGLTLERQTTPVTWQACRRAAELCGAGNELSLGLYLESDYDAAYEPEL